MISTKLNYEFDLRTGILDDVVLLTPHANWLHVRIIEKLQKWVPTSSEHTMPYRYIVRC